MKTHFFFALVLPDEVNAYLHGVTEQIKPDYPFKKWLHQADYHITMAFLGDAHEPMRMDAIKRVKQALAGEPPFNLELSETGVFGKKDSPRILWAVQAPYYTSQEIHGREFQPGWAQKFSLHEATRIRGYKDCPLSDAYRGFSFLCADRYNNLRINKNGERSYGAAHKTAGLHFPI